MTDRCATLRALVSKKQGLVVPGAYDGISARLVQDAGFPAVYMTGYGTAASRLGLPDLGFAGLGEMADHARNLASIISLVSASSSSIASAACSLCCRANRVAERWRSTPASAGSSAAARIR